MTMKITAKGFNRVGNNLRGLASRLPRVTDSVTYPWGQRTRGALKSKKYPSKRAGQTYVRTGKLGNSWYARRPKLGSVDIGNTAPYAHWVIGNASGEGQAWMHYKRWWTARPVIEERIPELTKLLSERLQRELSK